MSDPMHPKERFLFNFRPTNLVKPPNFKKLWAKIVNYFSYFTQECVKIIICLCDNSHILHILSKFDIIIQYKGFDIQQ